MNLGEIAQQESSRAPKWIFVGGVMTDESLRCAFVAAINDKNKWNRDTPLLVAPCISGLGCARGYGRSAGLASLLIPGFWLFV